MLTRLFSFWNEKCQQRLFLLPPFPPFPALGRKAPAALPHRLAGNLKQQQAAARTTPRQLFFFPHWCRKLFNWGLTCQTYSLTLTSSCLTTNWFFSSLSPPFDKLPTMKMLLSLIALLSAALIANAAPPTCYSRVLSLSKEITESFKELQTSKAVVSLPKTVPAKMLQVACFWHKFISKQNYSRSFFFPAGLMCGDAAQLVLGYTCKFSHFFFTALQ